MIHRTTAIAISIVAVAGGVAAYFWATSQPDRYSSTAVVALAPSSTLIEQRDVIDVVGTLDRGGMAETVAGLAISVSVTDPAGDSTGLDSDDLEEYEIDALRVLGANIVDIDVSGPDPVRVAALANSVASEVQSRFTQIYRVYQVDIVSPAKPAEISDRPSSLLITLAGIVLGALLAAIVASVAGQIRRDRYDKPRT